MKGTNADQDARFGNKDKKLLKSIKSEISISGTVDMEKIMLDTLKTWIAARVTEMLGFEDDVLIEYVYELLECEKNPDFAKIQLNLTPFLEAKNSKIFIHELHYLLKSAEENGGIPKEFVELRKAELAQEMSKKQEIEAVISSATQESNIDTIHQKTPDSSKYNMRKEGQIKENRRSEHKECNNDKKNKNSDSRQISQHKSRFSHKSDRKNRDRSVSNDHNRSDYKSRKYKKSNRSRSRSSSHRRDSKKLSPRKRYRESPHRRRHSRERRNDKDSRRSDYKKSRYRSPSSSSFSSLSSSSSSIRSKSSISFDDSLKQLKEEVIRTLPKY